LQLFSGSVSGQKSGTKTGSGGGTTWKAWVGTVIQKLSLGRSTSNTLLQLFSGLVSGKKSLLRSTSNTTLQLFSGAVTGVKSVLKTWSGGSSTWQAWTSTLLQKLSLKRPLTNTTAQLFSGTVTYWRPGMAHNYYASVGGGSFSVSGSVSKKYGLFRSLSGHFGKLKGRGATYKDELYYGVPAP
jgi:hypothetical protein